MGELLKGWISVLIHFAVGFCLCLGYVFLSEDPAVLPQFVLKWKLVDAELLFIWLMPSLLVSSILIGYAVIFGLCGQNTVPRYSAVLLRYLRDVFIILSFCTTVYIVLVEIVTPALLRYRHYSELKTQDYYDFIKNADAALKNDLFEEAYANSRAALAIQKESDEAAKILDAVRVLVEDQMIDDQKHVEKFSENNMLFAENLTAEGALYISKRYMELYDFYTAHFYAMRSYKLSNENGPYRKEAMRLAAQSWNQIEKGMAEITAEFDIKLYQAKKNGYEMMMQENYIKAYYQFIEAQQMIASRNPLKRDPDIDRFVEITRQKLLEEAFFIEEFESLSAFESVKHIHFTVPAVKELSAVNVKMEGLVFIAREGIQEIYGKNCEITQYNHDNTVRFKCSVPVAKFVPVLHSNGQSMIRMLLQAVDKKKEGVVVKPTVLEGSLPEEQLTIMAFPFSYNTFELIIAACEGEKTMTLPQLYAFRKIGPTYGFSAKIYHREIISRISDTLLILVISVYMLVIAWGFRIPQHERFKSRWICSFPVFFVGSLCLVETVRYCSRLLIAGLTNVAYDYSTVLIFITYIIFFVGVSFLFFAQRSDI